MEKGTLVEFRLHGDRRLAVVDRPEGKKHLQVIDENGTPHTLHPREIDYVIQGKTNAEPEKFTVKQIPTFHQQVKPYLDPDSLAVAWEILVEEHQPVTPEGLAQLLFSEVSAATTYAAYCLLSEDKLYFKQKGNGYEPRSTAQVTELKHQAEVAAARAQEANTFLQKLKDKLVGEQVEWTSSDRHRLESLERYAIHGEESSDKSIAIELLTALHRPKSDTGAFQLLVDLGLWNVHENLFLRRSQIPIRFSAELLSKVREFIDSPTPDSIARLDLTHLHVYTIDDESTREIDDGLSVETIANGKQRLWIHIADPSRWVQPNDIFDREARKRGTSVYLPTGTIPMFPLEFATGVMSLVQGQICHALSFAIELDDDGMVVNYDVCASSIKPSYRLTYEDVTEMLELGVEADLEAIARYARLRTNWRRLQGAINIDLPETTIKVDLDDPESLTLEILDDSFSRQLVAEMMILTGEVAAKFAQANNIPIPYRYQEQPDLPSEEEILQLPPGPVREFAICRCMTKGEAGVYPLRHAGLGLDAYAQVTSPIRRYSDLLAHWQIKAHLSGQPLPFTVESLSDLLHAIDPAIFEAVQIERQTTRYWSLEYLRRHRDTVWRALLLDWLRENERLGLILLEDLGLKLPMRMTRNINIGESLSLKVSDVDPRKDIIQFQEIQAAVLQAT
ncbi:ribonuclease catalytic domain-containing protein [Pseudanabaena sp. PCC 6802]|uniref:ribonuclease catalytic domain-containing protein n=1 Tax=Pseudanabaena sp. PCC 6802 TaxID=118173 RepID=UPI0003484DDC|nr:ribonuclease R family protein [Pseudanabaena sp. PCC 6802]